MLKRRPKGGVPGPRSKGSALQRLDVQLHLQLVRDGGGETADAKVRPQDGRRAGKADGRFLLDRVHAGRIQGHVQNDGLGLPVDGQIARHLGGRITRRLDRGRADG